MDYPTDDDPEDCSTMEGGGFPCNNGFDTTGKILTHLLTNIEATGLSALEEKDYEWNTKGVYRRFRQRDFYDAGWFNNYGL